MEDIIGGLDIWDDQSIGGSVKYYICLLMFFLR